MKTKIIKTFTILFMIMLFVCNVNAREVAKANDIVNDEGNYESTRFLAGNNVTDKSVVDGIKFVAGNNVTLNGSSPYAFYAGNIVTINANIEKDLFAAGNSLTIGSEAVLGRDVYIAGNTVKINANIARDLRVGASSVDIKGITINGDAKIDAEEIILDENTIIEGKLEYLEDTKVDGLDKAKIGSIVTKKAEEIKIDISLTDKIWSFVISLFAGFVVLIALFRFIPESKKYLDKEEINFDNIARKGCTGLIALIVVPLISLFALVSGILTPIALIVLCLYAISIYLSFLVVSYIIGKLIFTKLIKNDNIYLMMLCGYLVYKLVVLIPVLGGIVSIITLFYGLGLIYKFVTLKRN